jgi:hypothetical protein
MSVNMIAALIVSCLLSLSCGCRAAGVGRDTPLRAYCIDFNWGAVPGDFVQPGVCSFARPGLWADADPAEHVEWYAELGCNVIQSFAVSCNGYAWYKNGIVPEQPGLKHDFLTEQVRLAHRRHMLVIGYFCAGANTKWGREHPDLSYGISSMPHIPYTNAYLDYLCASISDAVRKTGIDGIMIDWLWNPGATMEPYPPLRWLPCEQTMFRELMGQPFPGKENIAPGVELQFRRKAIDRCWRRIRAAVKQVKPNCIIWLTSCQLTSRDIAGSAMLKEVDWVLNEAGDVATTESVRSMLGRHTRLLTCLANWNRQDPTKVVPAALDAHVGLYGFTKPVRGSLLPPVSYYLSRPVDSFQGDEKNVAVLARVFHNLPLSYVRR